MAEKTGAGGKPQEYDTESGRYGGNGGKIKKAVDNYKPNDLKSTVDRYKELERKYNDDLTAEPIQIFDDEFDALNFAPDSEKDNFLIEDKTYFQQGAINGIERDKPMSFYDADNAKTNPHYREDKAYQINCQSCVAVFEARLRGYDLEALPFNSQNILAMELARNPEKAYDNPQVQSLSILDYYDRKDLHKALSGRVNDGERHNLIFRWQDRATGKIYGHIVECHKINDEIVLYDPQSNYLYKGKDINRTIGEYGFNFETFRIDNLKFNKDFISSISKGIK